MAHSTSKFAYADRIGKQCAMTSLFFRCGVPDKTLTRNSTEHRLMSNPMREGYSTNQRLTRVRRTRRSVVVQQESSLQRPVRRWFDTKRKRPGSYVHLGESNIFEGELPRDSR